MIAITTIEEVEYAPSGCRWSTVALLVVVILYLVSGLVGAERENDRLKVRVAQLEGRAGE